MKMRSDRRRWLLAAGLLAANLTGCGTVLHPERRGQPAGRIDWAIFALDAIGLIFFFIPGVVAFAVDFATGAIYLPPNHPPTGLPLAARKLRKVQAPAMPTVAEVEALVSRETGRDVQLSPGDFRSEPLPKIDDFWPCHARLAREARA